MVARHLTDEEIRRFAQRSSADAELWAADAHLRDCAECRARLEALAPSAARVESLRRDLTGSRHLDFDTQLVPYVDGALGADARREVEAHLATCDVCRREVADLRPLATLRRRAPVRWLAVAALLVLVIAAALIAIRRKPAAPPIGKPVVAVPTTTQPPITVSLRDGDRVIAVDAAGALHGIALDAATSSRIAAALQNPKLAPPAALAALIPGSGELRGETAPRDFAVVAPVGTATLDARPRFMWRGTSNSGYRVSVVDESGGHWGGGTNATEWTPPADFPRGRAYTWQVSTMIDGHRVFTPAPPQPEARFRVVDEATVAAIEAARRQNATLVAALLSYDAGAITEARRDFERIAADNPASPIPRQLIESCDRAARRAL